MADSENIVQTAQMDGEKKSKLQELLQAIADFINALRGRGGIGKQLDDIKENLVEACARSEIANESIEDLTNTINDIRKEIQGNIEYQSPEKLRESSDLVANKIEEVISKSAYADISNDKWEQILAQVLDIKEDREKILTDAHVIKCNVDDKDGFSRDKLYVVYHGKACEMSLISDKENNKFNVELEHIDPRKYPELFEFKNEQMILKDAEAFTDLTASTDSNMGTVPATAIKYWGKYYNTPIYLDKEDCFNSLNKTFSQKEIFIANHIKGRYQTSDDNRFKACFYDEDMSFRVLDNKTGQMLVISQKEVNGNAQFNIDYCLGNDDMSCASSPYFIGSIYSTGLGTIKSKIEIENKNIIDALFCSETYQYFASMGLSSTALDALFNKNEVEKDINKNTYNKFITSKEGKKVVYSMRDKLESWLEQYKPNEQYTVKLVNKKNTGTYLNLTDSYGTTISVNFNEDGKPSALRYSNPQYNNGYFKNCYDCQSNKFSSEFKNKAHNDVTLTNTYNIISNVLGIGNSLEPARETPRKIDVYLADSIVEGFDFEDNRWLPETNGNSDDVINAMKTAEDLNNVVLTAIRDKTKLTTKDILQNMNCSLEKARVFFKDLQAMGIVDNKSTVVSVGEYKNIVYDLATQERGGMGDQFKPYMSFMADSFKKQAEKEWTYIYESKSEKIDDMLGQVSQTLNNNKSEGIFIAKDNGARKNFSLDERQSMCSLSRLGILDEVNLDNGAYSISSDVTNETIDKLSKSIKNGTTQDFVNEQKQVKQNISKPQENKQKTEQNKPTSKGVDR